VIGVAVGEEDRVETTDAEGQRLGAQVGRRIDENRADRFSERRSAAVELDENRRAVWLSSAPWNSRVEYACIGSGEATRIRADYVGDLSDSLRWQVGWLPGWATHWILAQDFRRLDRLLTRECREADRWQLQHPRRENPPDPNGADRRAGTAAHRTAPRAS